MCPTAESWRFGSKSSSTMPRSLPRSPRNDSSVRGSRPSPSAKLARRTPSRASAARSLAARLWSANRSNSARTASTFRVTPTLCSAVRPIRTARSTRMPWSSAGCAASQAASGPSWSVTRSTSIRSATTRTPGWLVGKETMRASMARTFRGRCDKCLSQRRGPPRTLVLPNLHHGGAEHHLVAGLHLVTQRHPGCGSREPEHVHAVVVGPRVAPALEPAGGDLERLLVDPGSIGGHGGVLLELEPGGVASLWLGQPLARRRLRPGLVDATVGVARDELRDANDRLGAAAHDARP